MYLQGQLWQHPSVTRRKCAEDRLHLLPSPVGVDLDSSSSSPTVHLDEGADAEKNSTSLRQGSKPAAGRRAGGGCTDVLSPLHCPAQSTLSRPCSAYGLRGQGSCKHDVQNYGRDTSPTQRIEKTLCEIRRDRAARRAIWGSRDIVVGPANDSDRKKSTMVTDVPPRLLPMLALLSMPVLPEAARITVHSCGVPGMMLGPLRSTRTAAIRPVVSTRVQQPAVASANDDSDDAMPRRKIVLAGFLLSIQAAGARST
eukprot:6203920-Pleurochrysis_carterae.AAC.4